MKSSTRDHEHKETSRLRKLSEKSHRDVEFDWLTFERQSMQDVLQNEMVRNKKFQIPSISAQHFTHKITPHDIRTNFYQSFHSPRHTNYE
jgi:hypothetical protein